MGHLGHAFLWPAAKLTGNKKFVEWAEGPFRSGRKMAASFVDPLGFDLQQGSKMAGAPRLPTISGAIERNGDIALEVKSKANELKRYKNGEEDLYNRNGRRAGMERYAAGMRAMSAGGGGGGGGVSSSARASAASVPGESVGLGPGALALAAENDAAQPQRGALVGSGSAVFGNTTVLGG